MSSSDHLPVGLETSPQSTTAPEISTSGTIRIPEHKTDLFKHLTLTDISIGDLTITSPSSPEPHFYVRNSSFHPSLPSVTLNSTSKTGPILGILKLSTFSKNTFALGDPSKTMTILEYESLRKVSKWTHNVYEWDCGTGRGRKRTFRWKKTTLPLLAEQPNLELREVLINGIGAEMEGDVLAVFEGTDKLFGREKGSLYLRKELGEDLKRNEKENVDEWTELELLVVLTGCGVIESHRRRTRARRNPNVIL